MNKKNKFYLILFLFSSIFITGCSDNKSILVNIGKLNRKVVERNMNEKLVVSLSSYNSTPIEVSVVIHNLTDDVTDMPILKKEYTIYKGLNYIIINLKEIGVGKYSLRLYYNKEIIDYRILKITQDKIK